MLADGVGLIPLPRRVMPLHELTQEVFARTEFCLHPVKGLKVDFIVPKPEFTCRRDGDASDAPVRGPLGEPIKCGQTFRCRQEAFAFAAISGDVGTLLARTRVEGAKLPVDEDQLLRLRKAPPEIPVAR